MEVVGQFWEMQLKLRGGCSTFKEAGGRMYRPKNENFAALSLVYKR